MPPASQFGVNLKPIKDPCQRDRWARLRFSVIGPLLAAPPDPGELQTALGLCVFR